jgi:hypothetical protein
LQSKNSIKELRSSQKGERFTPEEKIRKSKKNHFEKLKFKLSPAPSNNKSFSVNDHLV